MLGFPTNAIPPAQAELLAYVPHDDKGRVDIWLRVGDQPRAYDVVLDDSLKRRCARLTNAWEKAVA